jgi:dolichol-phosphate mannosyltransferase
LPYEFRSRHAGESKLDTRAKWDYGMLLLDKLVGHLIPVRFIAFILVGGVGVFVHLIALTLLFKVLRVAFVPSQILATFVAMTTNFALNNGFTYRDIRLRGWQWLRGWATFILACSLGTLANVGIAAYLFERDAGWTVARLLVSQLALFGTTQRPWSTPGVCRRTSRPLKKTHMLGCVQLPRRQSCLLMNTKHEHE